MMASDVISAVVHLCQYKVVLGCQNRSSIGFFLLNIKYKIVE